MSHGLLSLSEIGQAKTNGECCEPQPAIGSGNLYLKAKKQPTAQLFQWVVLERYRDRRNLLHRQTAPQQSTRRIEMRLQSLEPRVARQFWGSVIALNFRGFAQRC